jgi:hypothetical protein
MPLLHRGLRVLLVLLCVLPSLLFAPLAHATGSSGFDLTTSPLPIDLTTLPGHVVATDLRVQNSSTKPAVIKVSLMKFSASGERGNPQLLPRGPADDYFDWVSFSKNSFSALPGQWTDVKMTINVPPSGAFGYYYAVVFSNANAAPKPTLDATSLNGAVATLVLLDVNAPGEKRSFKVSDFSATHKFYEFLPAIFNIKVHNDGNIHGKPSGSIFITKGGHKVATLDVNPVGGNVLPGSNRIFSASWNDGFPVYQTKMDNGQIVSDKNSRPIQQLQWNFSRVSKLRFGHYSAHMVLTYDDGTKDVPIEGTVSFWVIPWRVVGGAIIILVFMTIGFWSSFKRLGNFIKRRTGRSTKHEK